jgi:hypothetical protein
MVLVSLAALTGCTKFKTPQQTDGAADTVDAVPLRADVADDAVGDAPSCKPTEHVIAASDAMIVDYARDKARGPDSDGNVVIDFLNIDPSLNTNTSIWFKFPTVVLPAASAITSLSLGIYVQRTTYTPTLSAYYTTIDLWSAQAPLVIQVSPVYGQSSVVAQDLPVVIGRSKYPLDGGPHDWASDVQDGYISLGLYPTGTTLSDQFTAGVSGPGTQQPPLLYVETCE